jgi:hypothetical protein
MKPERRIALLFGLSTLLASALLFLVQPMCAKMVLPCLGGSPHVWTTSMLFFQTGLLLGYTYAYLGQRIGIQKLGVVHVLLMGLAAVVVWRWTGVDCSREAVSSPVGWLLRALTSSIGLPFVLLASASPLLQFCFATCAPGKDPYSLYAASNTGSLLGLLGYPFVVERFLSLPQQTMLWSGGFILFALFLAAIAFLVCARRGKSSKTPLAAQQNTGRSDRHPALIVRWLFLAFVPVSLMLSVTSHLSANLSAAPILWMIPLSLYLLTYILAFSARLKDRPQPLWERWMPVVVIAVLLALLIEATEPLWAIFALHLLGLFWIGMLCHTRLSASRPPVDRLTAFYLCIAAGGAMAGLFNTIVAPLIFNTVAEYPLMLAVAALVGHDRASPRREGTASRQTAIFLDGVLPVALALATWLLSGLVLRMQIPAGPARSALIFGVPLVICYTFTTRPVRFALGICGLLLAANFSPGAHGVVEAHFRSFFGTHQVTKDSDKSYRLLIHGNTEHGRQSLDPRQRSEPLAYYHRTGPVGDLFATFAATTSSSSQHRKVAVIGLGAGTLAAYAKPGEEWTFYEIDSAVVALARDSGYFSYLSDAVTRGAQINIVLGDGRLELASSPARYALMIVDAFSSDTIPLHLATREAFEIYRQHLTSDGVLGVHYSSRYLDLRPILARLAASAELPMIALFREDLVVNESEKQAGKAASKWGVMTTSSRAGALAARLAQQWHAVGDPLAAPLWTDNSSNLLDALVLFQP